AFLDHHHAVVPGRPLHAEAEVTMDALCHLAGQQVLILGLGTSGLAMARWCARCGANVTVADTRAAPPQLEALRTQLPQVRFVGGEFDQALLEGMDAVFRSPGLSPAQVAPVFIAARARGVRAESELGL